MALTENMESFKTKVFSMIIGGHEELKRVHFRISLSDRISVFDEALLLAKYFWNLFVTIEMLLLNKMLQWKEILKFIWNRLFKGLHLCPYQN